MPESTSTPSATPSNRGRGRGRGGAASSDNTGPQQNRGRGGGGSRGGGPRGGRHQRGGQAGRRQQQQQRSGAGSARNRPDASGSTADGEPPDPGAGIVRDGISGDRLTGAAKRAEGEAKGKGRKLAVGGGGGGDEEDEEDDAEGDEGDICFICASKVAHTAIAPCNHQTCHICALRLRALYKTKACAHCRTESPFVIFTNDPNKQYEDFEDSDFVRTDNNLGIKYEAPEIFEDTVLLLRYNCPDEDCDVACLGWPDLHRHVKSKHGKIMCDLCTRNKKVFTHEHGLFSVGQLRHHERHGDDNPGAINQSGFKGHPECGFCRQRFYGDDELYVHCRDKHERCHICDRHNGNRQPQYFVDYNALEAHFGGEHFLCLDKECLEKKFVVFESQMDLKAHQLEAHPAGESKDVRRDARVVDLAGFDYRSPYQPQRQQRQRQGAGRGRDPNAEPVPASSAQPLRRDEMAYQRQLAIQSAQSVSSRSFGGQLTRNEPPPARQASPQQQQPASTTATNDSLPQIENLDLGTHTSPSTPQEQARRIAHEAVVSRASSLLGNDGLKLSEFREKVSAYRKSAISASNLIEAFFSLFDTSPNELGKLIKELAHLYEDEAKRANLLQAWNDWRAINEDYPTLPGPSGNTPLTSSSMGGGGGGKRVLRLKSSTAPSSRSAVGPRGSIGGQMNGGGGGGGSSEVFPPLAGAGRSGGRKTPAPAWGGAAAVAPASTSSPARMSPASSRPASRGGQTTPRAGASSGARSEAFPALPAAQKPNTLMAGLTRGTVRWEDKGAANAGNAWASRSNDPTPSEANAGASVEETGKKGKGKKGKGKGQMLYHFG